MTAARPAALRGAGAPRAVVRPSTAWLADLRRSPFVAVAFVLLVGYLVLGRGFAQIGLPSASLFLGEVVIAAFVMYRPTREVLSAGVTWLVRPHALHVVTFSFAAFVAYGLFQLAAGIRAGYPVAEAAKNFAFNYYPVLLFAGLAVGATSERFLDHLNRVLPWVNAFYVVFFLLILRGATIRVPFSATPGLTPGSATMVAIALMLTRDRPPSRRWYLLMANGFCLLFLQIRGDWLGTALGLALWATLLRRWRQLIVGLIVTIVTLTLVSVFHVQVPGALDRGGGVAVNEIVARAVAPIDKDLAAKYSDQTDFYAGTAEWRTKWWGDIWDSVNANGGTRLIGHGYGYPLADLSEFLRGAEVPLRTPHNVFFYALGYSGWVGVGLFVTFHGAVLAALWRVYRSTGDPFGLMLWVMGTAAGSFGNFFETPYNAAPYWFLIGVVLAPLAFGAARNGLRETADLPVSRAGAHNGSDPTMIRTWDIEPVTARRAPRRRSHDVIDP